MRWLPWVLATFVVAMAVHVGSVWVLPHVVMGRAMAMMGATNTIHHGKRADATSHGVVRPSPDLLYSSCPFDVSHGALRVRAPVPPGTYWSVSLFDAETNNFYVLNDRQAHGAVDLILVGPHQDKQQLGNVVRVPTDKGLVLFRTLVNDEKNFAAIDDWRRQATCAPWAARPSDVSSGR